MKQFCSSNREANNVKRFYVNAKNLLSLSGVGDARLSSKLRSSDSGKLHAVDQNSHVQTMRKSSKASLHNGAGADSRKTRKYVELYL